jgi:hypothetical protein
MTNRTDKFAFERDSIVTAREFSNVKSLNRKKTARAIPEDLPRRLSYY